MKFELDPATVEKLIDAFKPIVESVVELKKSQVKLAEKALDLQYQLGNRILDELKPISETVVKAITMDIEYNKEKRMRKLDEEQEKINKRKEKLDAAQDELEKRLEEVEDLKEQLVRKNKR